MPADNHGKQPGLAPDHCVGHDQPVDDAVAKRIFNRSRHRNARLADGYDDNAVEFRQIGALVADYEAGAISSHTFIRDPFDVNRQKGAKKDFDRNGSRISGGM
jgi:hypothetical protein